MLIALSGLPGVGKTTIARELARATGAIHLRIDSIERALRQAGWHIEDEGYRVAYAMAEDNLRLGRVVISDCVNPWPLTRDAWRSVAVRAGVRAIDVEIVCTNAGEHRRRVEARRIRAPAEAFPTWQEVLDRDYRPWDRERLVIDTAQLGVEDAVRAIGSALAAST